MRQTGKILLLVILPVFIAQAAVLSDFGAKTNWVIANANGQGLTATVPKYVPFSMVSPRSPTNGASGYAGPVYYGGVTGTVSVTGWTIGNSTPDYIIASGTSTGIGSRMTSLVLFTNQSATVTQVVYSYRIGGSTDAQTNFVRIVIRKTDGSFYISEPKSGRTVTYFTNSNPASLTWYNYNPASALLTIGSQASGLALDNVDAIGEFIENTVTATNQTSVSAGIPAFQAWGDTVQNQTVTFPNPGTQLTTNSVTLNATASSGLTVTYALVSGPASLNGSTVTFTGSGTVTLSADQSGNANWNPAPQTNVTFTVNKAAATVTLNGLSQTYDGSSKTVTAITVPSGKTVDITYDGSAAAPVNAGSYAIVGTVNDTMYQGSASDTLVVAKASQTVTFTNPGNQITTNSVTLSATASSGLSPTFGVVSGSASIVGSTVTFSGSGSVTLSANQSGNANWNSAPQTNVTFVVSKATTIASVTLSGLNQTYDGLEHSVSASTTPAGLAVGITYNGSSSLPVAAGNYSVVATVSDPVYQGSASGTLALSLSNLNVAAYAMSILDVWTNGLVRYPGASQRAGRQSTNIFSATVMAFELPDLKGASIISAALKFRVDSKTGTMTSNNNCNINVEAIRSGAIGSAIGSNDYRTIGLSAGESAIQTNVALWNDSFPRDYQTAGAATNTLAAWLGQQYTNTGIGGVVFLRLAPSQNVTNNTYYNIPSDSISLVITTDGDVDPQRGFGNTVSARIGPAQFSWTFDQNVEWGHFIDGMPWVVMPQSGYLSLVSATPARLNNQSVKYYISTGVSGSTNADINITVKNPPFDHTFDTATTNYVDNTNGVCGWDSRIAAPVDSPKYNPSLGWDGVTYLSLSAGDSIATAKSTVQDIMPDRATSLDALAVVTVLTNIPPNDAFRPAVIRSGFDRTNPEILRYSQLIDLSPYLISNPVGVTTDLRGTNVSSIAAEFTFRQIRACLPGPWFINTGYAASEGANARFNNYAYIPNTSGGQYGGFLGLYMGYLAVGSLADWLTEDEQKICRIRYIQRAIDVYGAVKAGVCLEEGCGVLPGYSTLLTVAGVMMNHSGMKSANQGVNGVKPWWIFADYATCWHTEGISTNDLAAGETMNDRLIPIYNISTNRSNLNKTNAQPVAAATLTTMIVKTNFYWDASRPINNIINLKFRIVSGPGAGSTVYVITNAITAGVVNDEKFRTSPYGTATLYNNSGVTFGYYYGGKVGVKPAFQNGLPDSSSVLTFSITTSDADNPAGDDAVWYWAPDGVLDWTVPCATLGRVTSICTSPQTEYSSIMTGATIGNLIALYALGQQDFYKGGLDKYMINAGERAGYGEVLFAGTYFVAVGTGTTGNFLGALWKQEVLSVVGADFQYTDGTSGALAVPHTHAKMFYEP